MAEIVWRLRLAFNILQGRPTVAYVKFSGQPGTAVELRDCLHHGNTFEGLDLWAGGKPIAEDELRVIPSDEQPTWVAK